jgi:hypothetical protein
MNKKVIFTPAGYNTKITKRLLLDFHDLSLEEIVRLS